MSSPFYRRGNRVLRRVSARIEDDSSGNSRHSFQRRSHALVPRATLLLFAFPTQGEANCQEEFFVSRVPLFKRGAWTIPIQGAYHIVYRSQLASDQTVCVHLSSGAVLAVLGFTLVIRKPLKIIVHILFHNITRANKLIFIGDKLGGLGQDSMWILPRKTYPGTVILFLSFGFLGPSSLLLSLKYPHHRVPARHRANLGAHCTWQSWGFSDTRLQTASSFSRMVIVSWHRLRLVVNPRGGIHG